MREIDRAQFLRLGVASMTTAGAAALLPTVAAAGPPTPTPIGDDIGFVQFGAVGERAALAFYRKALARSGAFSAEERRRLDEARRAKRTYVERLNAVLGPDAVTSTDFGVEFAKSSTASRRALLALGRRLEGLLVGVYLYGVGYAADPATRLLLGDLLAVDAQHLAVLRRMDGGAAVSGFPGARDVESAGDELDSVLVTPNSPNA